MNINHKIHYEQQVAAALDGVAVAVPYRLQLVAILSAALNAVNPKMAVVKNLRIDGNELNVGVHSFHLRESSRIVTIALGKAAPAMLAGAIEQLGDNYQGGVCVGKHLEKGFATGTNTISIVGNHPIPGEGSLQAGEAIRRAVTGLGSDDIVLLLVSGGGSSLATLPVAGVSLTDMREMTGTLLRSGATIAELNAVRKHLDQIKGGGLVRLAAPAKVASLVLSDVVGNNLEVIASGPAYPDPSTFAEAVKIVRQASSHGTIPESIRLHLDRGCEGKVTETLKPYDPDAQRCFNTIIASNIEASAAAAAQAQALGFHAEIVTNHLIGEAREAAGKIVSHVKQMRGLHKPFMLVWGGESTVTVRGEGKGGRNQELALAAVRDLAGLQNTLMLTLATDGEDGPTDAAGALINGETLERASILGLNPDDFLQNNDAYTFFAHLGDLLITGPTGTNVNDLTFVFSY